MWKLFHTTQITNYLTVNNHKMNYILGTNKNTIQINQIKNKVIKTFFLKQKIIIQKKSSIENYLLKLILKLNHFQLPIIDINLLLKGWRS